MHLTVFLWWGWLLLFFTFNTQALDQFGWFFGLTRGADLVVYMSIIVLWYMYIWLYNKTIKDEYNNVRLTRSVAIRDAIWSLNGVTHAFIVPAYNEWEYTIEVIEQVITAWYGVVFVDDGSRDELLSHKLQKKFHGKPFVSLRHLVNLWQWWALQTWFDYLKKHHLDHKNSSVQYVVTYDADGQMQLSDIPVFMNAFSTNKSLDIVLWSRFIGNAKADGMPFVRKIVLKVWILFTWFISGIKMTDAHNGYRVMTIETLRSLVITLNDMSHASEITDIIRSKKLLFTEVPVHIKYLWIRPSVVQSNGNALKIARKVLYRKLFFR